MNDKIYSKLQEIVGGPNITRNPAILDTYAFQWCFEIESAQRGRNRLDLVYDLLPLFFQQQLKKYRQLLRHVMNPMYLTKLLAQEWVLGVVCPVQMQFKLTSGE